MRGLRCTVMRVGNVCQAHPLLPLSECSLMGAEASRWSGTARRPACLQSGPVRTVCHDRWSCLRAIGVWRAWMSRRARGCAVAHCGVWELACGFTRAVAGSRCWCCCTAWALPAMCGRGGGRCSPGSGQAAGWRRTCPVMAVRGRYRATPSSPWPQRSPVSSALVPAQSCWDIRWVASSAWPWPAAGSPCRCRRSSAWGSRSPGPGRNWTARRLQYTARRPGSLRARRLPPATCASRASPARFPPTARP